MLSDNRPCSIAGSLALWLDKQAMDHVGGAPRHPHTLDKIKHWHQPSIGCTLLGNYQRPGDLDALTESVGQHFSYCHCNESLSNPTPVNVYFGRGQTIPCPPACAVSTHSTRATSFQGQPARRVRLPGAPLTLCLWSTRSSPRRRAAPWLARCQVSMSRALLALLQDARPTRSSSTHRSPTSSKLAR